MSLPEQSQDTHHNTHAMPNPPNTNCPCVPPVKHTTKPPGQASNAGARLQKTHCLGKVTPTNLSRPQIYLKRRTDMCTAESSTTNPTRYCAHTTHAPAIPFNPSVTSVSGAVSNPAQAVHSLATHHPSSPDATRAAMPSPQRDEPSARTRVQSLTSPDRNIRPALRSTLSTD